MTEFPELGFYALAGAADSSRRLLPEVRDGEALGLGTVLISERYNKKGVAALRRVLAPRCVDHASGGTSDINCGIG